MLTILSDRLSFCNIDFALFWGRMAINNIGDVGAASLAELLKTNRALKDIR